MAFTIKGQTKAAAAFKGISAIYWPILFKFGVQIAYVIYQEQFLIWYLYAKFNKNSE